MKKTLLLDCDGVIVNCATIIHSFAQDLLRRELPDPTSWTAWDHGTAMGMSSLEASRFERSICFSKVAYDIDFYEGAEEVVHELKEAFDLVFVTAEWKNMGAWVPVRQRLLARFKCDVIFTHAKHRVKGDLLVDDRIENVEANKERALLFDRGWNRASTHQRIFSLKEILEHK